MEFTLKSYTPPNFDATPFVTAPNALLAPAPKNAVMPEGYHATTIFPEYFKVKDNWLLAPKSRMDCAAVLNGDTILVKEFRRVKAGEMVFLGRTENGSEGIYVHTDAFANQLGEAQDTFAFRQGRSRETAFSKDYDFLYRLLQHEKENGYIVWVLGPACTFDADSRNAMARLINGGYVHALLAGNALATHDLEGGYKSSALGQDIYTQNVYPNGHYNHIDTINRVCYHGSIPAFIKAEGINSGIMYSLLQKNIPYVLAGSIRDDGPLPEVYADVYKGQDAMRQHIEKATTIIGMASTLHTVATGNMAPAFHVLPGGQVRQVYFYSVDISEFAVNKLGDRGSLGAKSIVTNAQDFVVNVSKGLGLG